MNLSPLVTLVDPDAKGLETLTYAFEKERFTVTGTPDRGRARQLIGATGARAAVIALHPPEQRALELIASLRADPATRTLPIVAIGPGELRAGAIAAGAFDYLDTPLLVRDVTIVSRLWLQVSAPTVDLDAVPEIVGSLDLLHGLYFLMRAMNATGRSGVLQLARGSRRGEVKFAGGAVTSAEVRGLQAFPALHQLLLWSGADVSLKLRDVPPRAQFSAKGPEILEECERFLRDVTHAARQLGSLQTVFATDERQGGLRQPGVPEEVAPVARFFDGIRTLGEVLEESPFRIFDTLRVVKRLIDSGALMPRGGAAGAGSGVPTNYSAVPRARTKSGAQVARTTQPRGMETAAPERRGAPGDRRKSLRRTPMPFEKPAAKAAPAPIPLVTKKSPSGAFAAGEIRSAPKVTRSTPHRMAPAARSEPSVKVKLDPVPVSLDAQISDSGSVSAARAPAAAPKPANARIPAHAEGSSQAAARAPAPVAAANPAARHPSSPAPISARQGSGSIRPKKNARTKTPVPGAPAFNDLEADFFAREADLYKTESRDSFEDLDRASDGTQRPSPRHDPPRSSRPHKK